MKSFSARAGMTLVELLVASAIVASFLTLVSWFTKGMTDHRIQTEKKLKLATCLQKVMFFIENDFYSLRRHTLGNVLCTNVLFTSGGRSYRTTSDPGFDLLSTEVVSVSTNTMWYSPTTRFLPRGIPGGYAQAFVNRTISDRFHGPGNMALLAKGMVCTVRSPQWGPLSPDRPYVLAGWVRSEMQAGFGLTCAISIRLASGGADLYKAQMVPTSGNWTYISVAVPANLGMAGVTGPFYIILSAEPHPLVTRPLTALFDDITLTPADTIADIDYTTARGFTPSSTPLDLNLAPQVGMVFFQSDPTSGDMREMEYVFANSDPWNFPTEVSNLLRFSSTPPERSWQPWWSVIAIVWSGQNRLTPLVSLNRLKVSWVNSDLGSGAQRPIKVEVTVLDPAKPSDTMTLSRTLFPPTD